MLKLNLDNIIFFTFLVILSIVVALVFPSLLGLWLLILSAWIALVAANITTVLYAFINIFLAFTFDYYLRWENTLTLFYRGDGASMEHLCLLTTLVLLVFYVLESSRAFRLNLYAHIPELNLRFSRLSGWVATCTLMAGGIYVSVTSGTVFQQQFDLDEIGRYAFLEYLSLLIIVALFSQERGRTARMLFVASAIFYTLCLVLASYRMAGTLSALAIFLGLMSGRKVAKYNIVGIILVGFVAMAGIGILRTGIMEVNLLSLLGYKYLGSYGNVLDSTFTGVIETSLIYSSYSLSLSFTQVLGNFIAIIAPFPSSFMPDSLNYHAMAKAYHQTRVPGGGVVAGYLLFTDYLLAIPLLWFFAVTQPIRLRIGREARPRHNSPHHLMYAILMITMMRWSLYGVYVLFKFVGIFLFIFLVDATVRNFFGRRINVK
ncbi:hypothetical protein J3456_16845 [Sulfitobacter sp. NFXS29]|uniref:hypothetical protein n=1 Tax=Sulfitobacter sp. NFXS29 TaxID=2818438 RepID=UPI0032DEE46C